jgi:hypothetical protein
MSWQEEFREAVLRFVVERGEPVDPVNGSHYSRYHHPDWLGLGAHLNTPSYIREGAHTVRQRETVRTWTAGLGAEGCPLDLERMSWRDATWTEFAGTFSEDERCSGIDADVWCACGRVAGVAWRWGGGYAELLKAVTTAGTT